MEIKAKLGKEKDSPVTSVEYPLLDAKTIPELVKNFGEDVVIAHAKSSMVVALQGVVRGLMKKNTDPKELQNKVSEWRPSLRVPGKSRKEKAEELIGQMSEEEKKELLKKLRAA